MNFVCDVLALARPEVRALTPYSSARMEAGAAPTMLNANESPWPPPGDDGRALNRYPEPQPQDLRQRLAGIYAVDSAQVLLGRGSDEAIDLLVRAFCRPGRDAIAICPPTFGMYAVCAAVQGADVIQAPLDKGFELDADAVLRAITPAVKLVFVCSPNNPSGGLVPLQVIDRMAAALSGRSLLIIDEAYIEFSGTPSAATLLQHHANLGVLRTLSKAWSLAGARVGALLAHADVVALLRRIMPPYPLPTPCSAVALAALDATGQSLMRERVAAIVSERERMAVALQTISGVRTVLPSAANFLCVSVENPAATYLMLQSEGILVRDVTRYPGLRDCLRISIGTRQDNDRVLAVMQAMDSATVEGTS